MGKQSLFGACKRLFRDGISGTYEVGNENIFLELYTQEDIANGTTIGDSSEDRIVVVAGDKLVIPEDYILTPVNPKKSLVIICNTFVNNGTVSMYQKAPNVLPHDLTIITKQDSYTSNIIIPAYANNSVSTTSGANGTNRNCGSGGIGNVYDRGRYGNLGYCTGDAVSGSGYAFGGGAGTGSCIAYGFNGSSGYNESLVIAARKKATVNETYPMRGGSSQLINSDNSYQGNATAGAGNPYAGTIHNRGYGSIGGTGHPPFGCGGRIIIFCMSLTNNGTINVNGTSQTGFTGEVHGYGGASGAGAIDIFYNTISAQGNLTATGGTGPYEYTKGGDGSITLTAWDRSQVVKPIQKYMSRSNMIFFLNNYVQRLKQED